MLGLVTSTAVGLLSLAACHWLGLARLVGLTLLCGLPSASSYTFPAFGAALATEPRSASGKFVCSNCHLLGATVEVSMPQAVFEGTSFDIWSKVPARRTNGQVRSDGTVGPLQLGRVLVFPEKASGYVQPASEGWTSWPSTASASWWIGPLGARDHSTEAVGFTVGSFTPGTYTVYLGANRGRGQLYPTGLPSNSSPLRSSLTGVQAGLTFQAKRFGSNLWVQTTDKIRHIVHAPTGNVVAPQVYPRTVQRSDDSLAYFRNVGGFGIAEASLTFQTPQRLRDQLKVQALLLGTQVALVLKKKQFERLKL